MNKIASRKSRKEKRRRRGIFRTLLRKYRKNKADRRMIRRLRSRRKEIMGM